MVISLHDVARTGSVLPLCRVTRQQSSHRCSAVRRRICHSNNGAAAIGTTAPGYASATSTSSRTANAEGRDAAADKGCRRRASAPTAAPPPLPAPAPQPEAATAPDDFPIGWDLKKESWHFHRRFYAIFKRPMQHGEYSHLLHRSGIAGPNISGRTAGESGFRTAEPCPCVPRRGD